MIRRRIPPDYFFFSKDALCLANKTKFKKKLKKLALKSPGLLRLSESPGCKECRVFLHKIRSWQIRAFHVSTLF
ncbi:MAG: hypothetical protein II564_00710, partial [Oscillospiraceae bacterium]|nr:hypothetical protein [Oscillospiraceae bacterium]